MGTWFGWILIDIDKFYNVDGEGFVICNGRWVVILFVALDINEFSFMYGCTITKVRCNSLT
jgi:hypothetical protein